MSALHEAVARIAGDRVERGEAGGVGELVEVDDLMAEIADEVAADGRADEPRSAGDEYPHRPGSQRKSQGWSQNRCGPTPGSGTTGADGLSLSRIMRRSPRCIQASLTDFISVLPRTDGLTAPALSTTPRPHDETGQRPDDRHRDDYRDRTPIFRASQFPVREATSRTPPSWNELRTRAGFPRSSFRPALRCAFSSDTRSKCCRSKPSIAFRMTSDHARAASPISYRDIAVLRAACRID